jgi:hypothetical protein
MLFHRIESNKAHQKQKDSMTGTGRQPTRAESITTTPSFPTILQFEMHSNSWYAKFAKTIPKIEQKFTPSSGQIQKAISYFL